MSGTSLGSPPEPGWSDELALFVLSAVLLALEVLETKIFSFTLDRISIYTAIGICQLGLGAGATLLALARTFPRERVGPLASAAAASAAATVVVSHAFFAETSYSLSQGGWLAGVTLVALTAPYFFLGLSIALILVARAHVFGRTYAMNLGGSAAGCLMVFPLLDALGGERSILFLGALSLAGAALFLRAAPRAVGALVAAGAALAIFAGPAPSWLVFQPDPASQLALVFRTVDNLRQEHPEEPIELKHVFKRWDRTTRIDVYELDSELDRLQGSMDGAPVPALSFMQDGDAGSFMVGVGKDLGRARALFEDTVYGAGYVTAPVEHAMLIGLGGAPDLLTALYYGVEDVDAVEINHTTIELARNEFAEFLGDPYRKPGVNVHQMDGRAFLKQTDRVYDLIQMSGVDTKSILPSGSLAINENYVYTEEAIDDLFAHLEPDGILAFIRAGDPDAHRLSSITASGLRRLGVEHPERHIFALAQGFFRAVLTKRSPFTPEEVEKLHAWVARRNGAPPDIVMPTHEMILLSFQHPLRIQYSPPPRSVATTPFFEALGAGQIEQYVANAELDLRPPVDDRPFFFLRNWPIDLIRDPPPGLVPLYRFVAELAALSALSVFGPLLVFRRRGLRGEGAVGALTYFFCLGAGFMLVEIGLIQRFVLLLGHQSYAITVVLFSMLAGAGAGSLFSARIGIETAGPLRVRIGALIAVVLAYGLLLPALFAAAGGASFAARVLLSVALLALLGFLMGMPFPSAMRSLDARQRPLVPWGIGVNAFASVFGATVAIPIAMLAGLRMVLLIGAALYALAMLTAPVGVRSPAASRV